MGIGPIALAVYTELARQGLLKPGQSIIELGSQEVVLNGWEDVVERFLKAFGSPAKGPWTVARPFMTDLGFTDYTAIDMDGCYGALRLDLNHPVCGSLFGRWDVVTNHGTTEHCFGQAACFQTMHDLAAVGGLMVHCVPMQGYRGHCFFLYKPELFEALASYNHYDLVGLWMSHDDFDKPRAGGVELVPCKTGHVPDGNVLLSCVVRKREHKPFRFPLQSVYRKHKGTFYKP